MSDKPMSDYEDLARAVEQFKQAVKQEFEPAMLSLTEGVNAFGTRLFDALRTWNHQQYRHPRWLWKRLPVPHRWKLNKAWRALIRAAEQSKRE